MGKVWVGVVLLAVGCAGAPEATPERARHVVDRVNTHDAELAAGVRQRKHARLAGSASAFFRGTPYLFWDDLGEDERLGRLGLRQATWISGDLHALNVGIFEDGLRRVVYDLNDLDHATLADPQLDLWRLAVSMVLAAREDGTLDAAEQREGLAALVRGYLDGLATDEPGSAELDRAWTAATAQGPLREALVEVEQGRSRARLLRKYVVGEGEAARFDVDRDDLEAPGAVGQGVREAWDGYLQTLDTRWAFAGGYFAIKDVARRLNAGLASLGVERLYVLVEGPTLSREDDVILDVKAQGACAGPDASLRPHAARVVWGTRALTPHADPHLGWVVVGEASFTVRERSPYKDDVELEAVLATPERFRVWAHQVGLVVAAAHARGDRDGDASRVRFDVEAAVLDAVADDPQPFMDTLAEVAFGYADQVERDHASFVAAFGGSGEDVPDDDAEDAPDLDQ